MHETVTIILVRHGETVENLTGVVQGQTDGTLSERGIEQARVAAILLAGIHFDAAYASDLGRALHTARIILDGRDDIPLVPDKRLREQDMGLYVGGPVSGYMDAIGRAGGIREKFDPVGGETAALMRGRVRGFLDDMAERHAGKRVLAVTHQGVIRMVADITGKGLAAGNAEPVTIQYPK